MQQNQSFRNPFISYLLMYILNRFGLDLVVHQDSKGVIHPAVLHNKLRHSRRRHETLHEESSRLGYFLFPGSVLDGDKELMPLDSLPMRMYDATRIWNDVAPMLTSLGGILRFVQGLFGAVRRFQLQQYFEERLAATCLFVCEAGYEENGLAVRTDNLALSIHQSDKPLRTRGVQFQGSTEELQPHNLVAFWQPAYVLTKAGISMGAFDTAVETLRSVWDKPNVIRTAALRGEIFINADFGETPSMIDNTRFVQFSSNSVYAEPGERSWDYKHKEGLIRELSVEWRPKKDAPSAVRALLELLAFHSMSEKDQQKIFGVEQPNLA